MGFPGWHLKHWVAMGTQNLKATDLNNHLIRASPMRN
jgi:hypothetical protein